MPLHVQLLGPPALTRDGEPLTPPRGRKAWAVLAYLVLAARPPSRQQLAGLVCADANDPLGALRWVLAQLRRALGPDCAVGGDPVSLSLPATAVVDVELLRRGRWEDAIDLAGLGRPLLEGVDVAASAAFEIWLEGERRHLDGTATAVLHEAAVSALSRRDDADAVRYARRLVELEPLDEANHVVLVQSLRAAGDDAGACEHLATCRHLFVSRLGVEPSPALQDAATGPPRPRAAPSTAPSVRALVDAGGAAVRTGSSGPGLDTLTAAVAAARLTPDGALLAEALLALGRGLVTVGRGGYDEGGAVLREAEAVAQAAGAQQTAAAALRELAFADMERGRYDLVRPRVVRAAGLVQGRESELAWLEAIDGAASSDQACYARAATLLSSAVARAARAGSPQSRVFARAFLGRLHLLRRELAEAADQLARAADDARLHWPAMLAWPESLLAEVQLLQGGVDAADARFERAYVMGRQVDDPCLESIAMRGRGLVAAARGRLDAAYALLVEAPRLSRRRPDSYVWIEAYALDALCTVAVEVGSPAAPRWVAELGALAGRCGMRELVARGLSYQARLGDRSALTACAEIVATIDNPALDAELAA